MTDDEVASYVDAACALHGIALRDDERVRVMAHFARLATLAAPLVDLRLADDVEIAPVFEP